MPLSAWPGGIVAKPRLALFVPHFAEYGVRLAIALSDQADVLLMVDARNLAQECTPALIAEARRRCRVMAFDSVGRSARIKTLLGVLARLLAHRSQVLLIQEQIDSLTAWVARSAGRMLPVLLTVHDPSPHSGNDTAYVVANAGNRRDIRASARAFHVHGRFCRDQLIGEVGDSRPIVETQHGVILVPESPKMQQEEQQEDHILMFGRMEAYKGLEVLLDAADILRKRGVAFRLTLAGRGPELKRLEARIGSNTAVTVIDRFLPPEDVTKIFQICTFSVMPYLNATQSGVVAAAFGNHVPVVASSTGGLIDAVEDEVSGLLVTTGDAVALANAMERMLTSPGLRQRLREGVERQAAGPFAWPVIAGTLIGFVQQRLIAGRGRV